MVGAPGLAPGNGPCNCGEESPDPVDMGTGLFVYRKTDLYEPDVIPIALTRTYRQGDNAMRDFGIGTQNPYDLFLVGDYTNYTYFDLVLPSGSEIYFQRTSPGNSYTGSVFQASTSAGPWFGATIVWNGSGWTLTRRDGTPYYFPDGPNSPTYQAIGLTLITDRGGDRLVVYRNSGTNTISQLFSPSGLYVDFTYDSNNRVTEAEDQAGRTILYTYDTCGTGLLCSVTDANGGVWKYTYNSTNDMTSITDPRGYTYLQISYDSNGRVHTETHLDGGTYQFSYTTNASGDITETDMTDHNGNVRKVTFDAPPTNPSGYATGGTYASITYAAGTPAAETYSYAYQSGTDLVSSVTDPLGRVTSYTYDGLGNTTSVTRLSGTPSAVTTSFAYDPTYSQLLYVTDPLGLTTNLSYDSKGNLTTISDPVGNVTKLTVDSEGRVLTATDPDNEKTTYGYTGADLTSVADPLNRTTNLGYDSAGRLTSVTSPMTHETQFAYNGLNEITSITDALNGVTSFGYDLDGDLTSVTDPVHTATPTSYVYNNMDQLETRTDPLGNSESYQYDKNGNLTQFTDRDGHVTTYQYDALNRLSFAGYGTQPGPTYASTIGYTYDLGDRLTQAVDSIAGTFTRSYDGVDRLTEEQGPEGTVSYQYDNDGRRTQMTVSGQSNSVNYAYDLDGRLTGITQGTAGVAFTYDAASRRSSLTLPNGVVVNYSYDAASQLSGIHYELAGIALGSLAYTYDNDGRRTQVGGSWARTGLPNPTTSNAVYNADNELTSWNGAALSYDANGNMTSDGTNTYTWDPRNHLGAISGLYAASFEYDPFGRRLQKTISGTTTDFLYDGADPVQELSGTTVTANLLTGLGVDEYFTRTDSTGTANFLTDALGSTIALADPTGTVQTGYTYDPFGGTTLQGAASANSYEFTGRENDGDGLYYYRARYYDPMLARFIGQDPLSLSGGSANLYTYAWTDPLRYRDPYGTDPIVGVWVGTAVGAVYGGIGGLMGGGGWRGVAAGAVVGAGVGALGGAIDPFLGLGAAATVGGVASSLGDLIGQHFAGAGSPCHPYNVGSAVGAGIGGLIGGGVGGYIAGGIEAAGGADWASALAKSTVEGNLGLPIAGVGGAIGAQSMSGRSCGCQ